MMKSGGLLAALMVTAAFSPLCLADEARPEDRPWTSQQAKRIVERVGDREPFLSSREAKTHADSLNHFFIRPDYAILRGNPVFGYWAEGAFGWVGTRVAWDGIRAVSESAQPITHRAWNAAFAYVAGKHGLKIDRNAPIRISGACVAAVLAPTLEEPNRGVALEVRIDSPTGPFLYRFGMGKPTIEDAVGAALDWAVGFARTINRGPTAPERKTQ